MPLTPLAASHHHPTSPGTATVFEDVVGGRDLTNNSTTSYSSISPHTKWNDGREFSGSSQYLEHGPDSTWDYAGDATFFCVFKVDDTTTEPAIFQSARTAGSQFSTFRLWIDNSGANPTLKFGQEQSGGFSNKTIGTIEQSEWHRICIIRPQNSTIVVFVNSVNSDGIERTTLTNPGAVTDGSVDTLVLGRYRTDELNGQITEFRMWKNLIPEITARKLCSHHERTYDGLLEGTEFAAYFLQAL